MLRGLALSLWASGDIQTARNKMMVYWQKNPQDRTAQAFLGDMAYSMGKLDSAIEHWSTLPIGQILVGRAEKALDRSNQTEAEILLALATTIGPHSYGLDYRVAEQYTRLVRAYGDQDEEKKQVACARAAEAYETALEFGPAMGFVYVQYGALLRSCGNLNEAIGQFLKVDESFQPRTRAWANHEAGLTYLLIERTDLAASLFEKAVSIYPTNGV